MNTERIIGVLMERMDLNLLETIKSSYSTVSQVVEWFVEVAKATLFAHSSGVIHSDIKPENILISTYGDAKLSDFGSATIMNASIRSTSGHLRGTAQYIAPEKIRTGPTPATDCFSFGMSLWEAFHVDVKAGLGLNAKEIENALAKGTRPKFTNSVVPVQVKSLVEKCWHQDATKRPTMDVVIAELNSISSTLLRPHDSVYPALTSSGGQGEEHEPKTKGGCPSLTRKGEEHESKKKGGCPSLKCVIQ
jgi:serine/threonine protein kinase